jgi:hypothetical protein
MLAMIVSMGLFIISTVNAAEMKLVNVKKLGQEHTFLYQCDESGNVFEVEQRYNPYAKAEEIRFVVNGNAGEWITEGIGPDLYRFFSSKACKESTATYAAVAE